MTRQVRVLFFTPSLGGGGAEMHLLRVANHLAPQHFSTSIAVAAGGGSYEDRRQPHVALHILATGGPRSSSYRILRSLPLLRRLIRHWEPDVVCSLLDHANLIALLATRGVPRRPAVVVGVQNPLSINHWASRRTQSRLIRALAPRLYPQADRVVALSRGVAADTVACIPAIQGRVETIYNAGLDEALLAQAGEPVPERAALGNAPLLVACGRLTAQKAFHDAIDALAQVRRSLPAHLWIIGRGELREALEQRAAAAGVSDAVRFLGFQANPFKYMAAADLFVLSSEFEGFGNVIVEAMACGTPVVATDCPHGPGEIISDGENGLLVPVADPAALAAAITRALTDAQLRQRLASQGRARAQAFHAEAIAAQYGELFLRVAAIALPQQSGRAQQSQTLSSKG